MEVAGESLMKGLLKKCEKDKVHERGDKVAWARGSGEQGAGGAAEGIDLPSAPVLTPSTGQTQLEARGKGAHFCSLRPASRAQSRVSGGSGGANPIPSVGSLHLGSTHPATCMLVGPSADAQVYSQGPAVSLQAPFCRRLCSVPGWVRVAI